MNQNHSIPQQLLIQLRSWIPHFGDAELRVWTYLASKVGRGDERHLPAGEKRKLSVFPLVATIATDTGLSNSGVRKAITSLKAKGLLAKYSRGKANGYILNHRILPNTATPVAHNTATPVALSEQNTATPVPLITCTPVALEGFNTEGINKDEGGSPTPQPTAKNEEGSGKSKTEDEEKIARVALIAKACGREINNDPRWAELHDKLGADVEPILSKVFGKWHTFKLFAESHYDTWAWKKNPHAEPVVAHFEMEKWLGATAAIAYLAHKSQFSDDDADGGYKAAKW